MSSTDRILEKIGYISNIPKAKYSGDVSSLNGKPENTELKDAPQASMENLLANCLQLDSKKLKPLK